MYDLAISIRNYKEDNYTKIIDSIKKIGFKNVFIEWYNDNKTLQENILLYARKSGLNVIFAHLGYQNCNLLWQEGIAGDKEVERYLNDIKVCSDNEIDLVVMHLTIGYVDYGKTEVGLKRIKKIVEYAKEKNVKIAFENTELKGYLEYIVKNIEEDNLGICFDVGHCNLFFNGEFDIDMFKNKVLTIHLHDNFGIKDDHNLPFDGNGDWNKTIKQLVDLNYKGYIVLEVGYNDYYTNISIDEFYEETYKRAIKIQKMLIEYKLQKD